MAAAAKIIALDTDAAAGAIPPAIIALCKSLVMIGHQDPDTAADDGRAVKDSTTYQTQTRYFHHAWGGGGPTGC